MKEIIEVTVKYEIEYETEEVRQYCINTAKKEVPIAIKGARKFNYDDIKSYSIVRVKEPNNVQ